MEPKTSLLPAHQAVGPGPGPRRLEGLAPRQPKARPGAGRGWLLPAPWAPGSLHTRSLKREMRNLSEECSLEPVTVSMAYVYFEKLVLQGKLNKQNRKLCAGACVLLAAKISSDLRKNEVKQLIEVSLCAPPRRRAPPWGGRSLPTARPGMGPDAHPGVLTPLHPSLSLDAEAGGKVSVQQTGPDRVRVHSARGPGTGPLPPRHAGVASLQTPHAAVLAQAARPLNTHTVGPGTATPSRWTGLPFPEGHGLHSKAHRTPPWYR